MRLRALPFDIQAVLISVLVMLLWFSQFLYWVDHYGGNLFLPAMAVSLFFLFVFGRKIYPALLFGALIGFLPQILIFRTGGVINGVIYTLLVLGIYALMLETFLQAFIFTQFKKLLQKDLLDALSTFLFITLIISAVFGFLFAFSRGIAYGDFSVLLEGALFNGFGIFMGIGFLTPLIYMGVYHDKKPAYFQPLMNHLINVLFIFLFILVTLMIMQNRFLFDYDRHSYIIVFFFILGALLFSYWIMLVKFLAFGLLFAILVFDATLDFFDLLTVYFRFTALIILTYILAITLKRYYDLKKSQNEDLESLNQELNKTLDYVHQFLQLSSHISKSSYDYNQVAKETFEVIRMVFSEVKYCFGFFDNQGELNVLNAQGYRVNNIPYFYELYDSFDIKNRDFVIIDHVQNKLESDYEKAKIYDANKPVQKRLYMIFNFTQTLRFVVGCDFYDEEAIHATRVSQMRDFTDLFNKLFMKQLITKQSLDLKDDIILTFVRTLDYYDRYTKGHSEAVANLAMALAKKLGLDQEMTEDIYLGGLLHDIGKLGIKSKVLNKEGKLDDDEYEHIKNHVNFGFDVLKEAPALEEIALIVRDHHEWWNGGGYPSGTKGEDISLGGRILSISDAVATMNDNRPYRKKMSVEAIIKELKRCRGTQFCPDCTDAMIELIEEGILNAI